MACGECAHVSIFSDNGPSGGIGDGALEIKWMSGQLQRPSLGGPPGWGGVIGDEDPGPVGIY